MKKMIYIVIGILTLLGILIFTGNKSVHHEVTINASPQQVWKVLMDTDKYHEWNPVMQLLEGEIIVGNQVKYQFTQDANNKSQISAKIEQIIPNRLLNQTGGMPYILTFNHKYILEAKEEQTKIIIHEDYRGIGVNFWNPKQVEIAYGRLNKALKNKIENHKK